MSKLTYLGEGLVRSLANWKKSSLPHEALQAWTQLWSEVGRDHPELEVPLRIFGVGVRYLKSEDSRVLLDLLASERAVLRQALGLDEEIGGQGDDHLIFKSRSGR